MANPIVITNVTQTIAPAPSTLQKTGAFISQGGTTLTPGTYSLLVGPNSLGAILAAALAVTSLAWASGTVTATTTAPHGLTTGDTFLTTISGATPAVYNGTFLATVTGASAFTYALASDGGTTPATGAIKYTDRNVAELVAMNTTFFAQGSTQAVYVLELGAGEAAAGVTALQTFITANPKFFYAYLVPRDWDAVTSFLNFAVTLNSTTSKTYFYTTSTVATFSAYTNLMKSIYWLVEAPGIPTTEFSAAGPFWDLLNTSPSTTNKVAPFEYRFQFGVTPWPAANNGVTLANITAANGNYIGTGAEGGISTAIVFGGQYSDGKPVNYWYAADWAQINCDLNIANAIINGSNNNINPLYYDQDGINRLQQVVASTMNTGITVGLVLNPVIQVELDGPTFAQNLDAGLYNFATVVNAVPFTDYTTENPSDYAEGLYAGLSVQFTPLRGFDRLIFNINVDSFA